LKKTFERCSVALFEVRRCYGSANVRTLPAPGFRPVALDCLSAPGARRCARGPPERANHAPRRRAYVARRCFQTDCAARSGRSAARCNVITSPSVGFVNAVHCALHAIEKRTTSIRSSLTTERRSGRSRSPRVQDKRKKKIFFARGPRSGRGPEVVNVKARPALAPHLSPGRLKRSLPVAKRNQMIASSFQPLQHSLPKRPRLQRMLSVKLVSTSRCF
jgi:hypothetical protein